MAETMCSSNQTAVLQDIEISFITGVKKEFTDDEFSCLGFIPTDDCCELTKSVLVGKFETAASSSTYIQLVLDGQQPQEDDNLEEFFTRSVSTYLSSEASDVSRQVTAMAAGIAALQVFVQANWTGPPLTGDGFLLHLTSEEENVKARFMKALILDGEEIYPLVKFPHYLVIARAILCGCSQQMNNLWTFLWWQSRCLHIHQLLLEERSPTIHDALETLFVKIATHFDLCPDMTLKILFHLEAARIHAFYYEVAKSKQHFEAAQKISNIDVSVIGVLGKRTRYQQEDIPQLALKVDKRTFRGDEMAEESENLPKDVQLNDDVRLSEIKYKDFEEESMPKLSPLEQAMLLGHSFIFRITHPRDELLEEQIMPYIVGLLKHTTVWSIKISALLTRSKLESRQSRAIERAMSQCQELVNSIGREKPPAEKRLEYFYSSGVPSSWILEKELADFLCSLACMKSALDIYLCLQLWEEAIACYHALELKHKAEEIIRCQLSIQETPKMWCLLGDATEDATYYEKAWELSNQRSGRAQRQWGLLLFQKKKYQEAIPHLQKSLEINSLQLHVWFRLAFAAMQVEDWQLCASSYRRCCTLDSENFEAWNNLSSAYVKLGQKERALRALQEAVKCNFQSWKVWDNLMVVSTDCGDFEELIRSYNNLLDLKEKHVDIEVLEILVRAIANDMIDCRGNEAGRLRKKALTLFGRLTAQVPNNARLWMLYTELTWSVAEVTEEIQQKCAQFLQKAYRSTVQNVGWEKDLESCKKVVQMCNLLANTYLKCSEGNLPNQQKIRILSSAKLALKGIITKIKQQQVHTDTGNMTSELVEPVTDLEEKLNVIIEQMASLQEHS